MNIIIPIGFQNTNQVVSSGVEPGASGWKVIDDIPLSYGSISLYKREVM